VATHDAARKFFTAVITWEAENESKGTWDRLLGATSAAVTGFDNKKSIVITDGSKGAAAAVEKRDTQHMLDTVHVSDYIKDKFKVKGDEYKCLYLHAFHAKNATELHAAKAKYPPELARYLEKRGPKKTYLNLAFLVLAVIHPLMLLSQSIIGLSLFEV